MNIEAPSTKIPIMLAAYITTQYTQEVRITASINIRIIVSVPESCTYDIMECMEEGWIMMHLHGVGINLLSSNKAWAFSLLRRIG
jgi:hypothetical protein